MKPILFSIFLTFAFNVRADFEKSMVVQVRDNKKLKIAEKMLQNLLEDKDREDSEVGRNGFDGRYFKIVHDINNESILFYDDPALVFRAATVYYHLTQARNYFRGLGTKLDLPNLDEKIVIRIDQTRAFSAENHWKIEEEYNGASSIGKSGKLSVGEWGREIWFHKSKKVKRKSGFSMASNYIDSRDFKNALLGQMLLQDLISFSNDWLVQGSGFGALDAQSHLMSMALSVGLVEILPKAIGIVGKHVKQTYHLDTALIPEIIYHEYSHQVLEPYLELKKVTSITEGYPNYFASKISGLKKLGARSGKHNKGDRPKRLVNKIMYTMEQEHAKQAAFGSFFIGLLNDLEESMGQQGFNILVNALKFIDSRSSIKADFYNAVFKSIDDVGTDNNNKKALKIKIHSVMQARGLVRG